MGEREAEAGKEKENNTKTSPSQSEDGHFMKALESTWIGSDVESTQEMKWHSAQLRPIVRNTSD